MSSTTRRMATLAASALFLLPAGAQPPPRLTQANPPPAPAPPPAATESVNRSYLERDTSRASMAQRETKTLEDLFQGQPTQHIDLRGAIEMALHNNLDVKYDKVSISLQRAEIKFAVGVFDPVFAFSTQYQQTNLPQNLNNPSTTSQILQQQGLQEQLNNAAINNFAIEQQSFNSYIASQQNLTAVNQQAALAGVSPSTLPNQFTAPTAPNLVPITNPGLNDIVVLNQTGATSNVSLSGKLPTGTRYAFQATSAQSRNTFTGDLNPVQTIYQDTIGLQLQQPILRGFGTDVNLADVRTARLNGKIQTLNWKNAISNAIQGVIAAYYDMTYAMDAMRVQEEAIAADGRLVELYRRRVELGFGSPFDISQAQVQVSSDREALLIAKNVFLERQFALSG